MYFKTIRSFSQQFNVSFIQKTSVSIDIDSNIVIYDVRTVYRKIEQCNELCTLVFVQRNHCFNTNVKSFRGEVKITSYDSHDLNTYVTGSILKLRLAIFHFHFRFCFFLNILKNAIQN